MKNLILIILIFIICSCATMKSPQEAGIAVSKLLVEVQAALDEINASNTGGTLPPLKSAQVTLNATEGVTSDGDVGLILTAAAIKSMTNSNSMTFLCCGCL